MEKRTGIFALGVDQIISIKVVDKEVAERWQWNPPKTEYKRPNWFSRKVKITVPGILQLGIVLRLDTQ